nr:coproporphyrinogen III oxidase [Caldimonas sp.]
MDIGPVRSHLLALQATIVEALEREGGDAFIVDRWQREPGGRLEGDGVSRLVEGGALLERGGVGFSHVRGAALPPSATAHRGADLAGVPFESLGVSLVFHPRNPYVPTAHMNVRMLAALPPGKDAVVWFGGGFDLTPYYGFEEDAVHFHRTARDALAPFGADTYPRFKAWCDEYFFLKHRNEPRGVGGIFYDYHWSGNPDDDFTFTRDVGEAFLAVYPEIVHRNVTKPWGPAFEILHTTSHAEASSERKAAGTFLCPVTSFRTP